MSNKAMVTRHNELATGDVVRLVNPESEAERVARYRVVEPRGDRVLIELLTTQMLIRPTEVVRISDVARA